MIDIPLLAAQAGLPPTVDRLALKRFVASFLEILVHDLDEPRSAPPKCGYSRIPYINKRAAMMKEWVDDTESTTPHRSCIMKILEMNDLPSCLFVPVFDDDEEAFATPELCSADKESAVKSGVAWEGNPIAFIGIAQYDRTNLFITRRELDMMEVSS